MRTETTNVSIPANSQSIKVHTSTKIKKKERKLKAKKQDESLPKILFLRKKKFV